MRIKTESVTAEADSTVSKAGHNQLHSLPAMTCSVFMRRFRLFMAQYPVKRIGTVGIIL